MQRGVIHMEGYELFHSFRPINMSLFLGNGIQWGRSYFGTLIGSRMFSFKPCMPFPIHGE